MAYTGSTSNSKQKQKQSKKRQEFLDVIFSWSLSDVLNRHLYKFQVEEVPLTFSSTTHYMNSFIYLLLEETRADMFSQLAGISQAPSSPFFGLWKMPTDSHKKMFYRMTLTGTKYDPIFGDLIALTQVKPKHIDDLARSNSPFLLAYVTNVINESPMVIQVLSSNDLIESSLCDMKERPKGFVVYLTNLTTNMRIWQALCNTPA